MIRPIERHELGDGNLLKMGELFFGGVGLPGRFIPSVFQRNWENFLTMGIGQIFVALADDVIVGAIGCLVHPDPYDDVVVAQEMFWFMTPEARRGILGPRLYYAFEEWATSHQAGRIAMATVFGVTREHIDAMQSIGKFYNKLGFVPVDVSYFKKL